MLTNWGGILSQLTGVTKTYLKMATRSLGPNGELMLVFDDKNAYEYVEQNRSDCQDALKAAAADVDRRQDMPCGHSGERRVPAGT